MLVTSKKERLMKHSLLVLMAVFIFSGCAAWGEYKRDYLKADEYHEDTLTDAYEELRDDYLE